MSCAVSSIGRFAIVLLGLCAAVPALAGGVVNRQLLGCWQTETYQEFKDDRTTTLDLESKSEWCFLDDGSATHYAFSHGCGVSIGAEYELWGNTVSIGGAMARFRIARLGSELVVLSDGGERVVWQRRCRPSDGAKRCPAMFDNTNP